MTDLFFTPKYQILNNSYLIGRQCFTGFYFRDFNRKTWKKSIKFPDLSILNFIFFCSKSPNLYKKLDTLEQAMCEIFVI